MSKPYPISMEGNVEEVDFLKSFRCEKGHESEDTK